MSKRAEGSGSLPTQDLEAAAAEQALLDQDWPRAKILWHQLACSRPQERHFRMQLMYARAGELLAAGEIHKAREELDRVLRMEPKHAGAAAMLKATRGGRLSRLLGL